MHKSVRLSVLANSRDISERFKAENHSHSFKPDWDIQMGQLVPVVRCQLNNRLTLDMLPWGVKSEHKYSCNDHGYLSAIEYSQPIYDRNFKRRCLIPVDILHESVGSTFNYVDDCFNFARSYPSLIALAGIWHNNKTTHKTYESFFILNSHNSLNKKFFNPVLVSDEFWLSWLGCDSCDLTGILSPYTFISSASSYLPQICRLPTTSDTNGAFN